MAEYNIEKILKDSNALLTGHFLLSSGLHSEKYVQCALVLQDPKQAELLGKLLADKLEKIVSNIDYVVAPAMGGIIIGYEVARSFNKPFMFTERVNNQMTLRRGFHIPKKSKVIIIEDVFTTGKSTKEVIDLLSSMDVEVVACGSIIDRSGSKVDFSLPKSSLLTIEVKNYKPDECPFCKKGLPLEKPGSRFIK